MEPLQCPNCKSFKTMKGSCVLPLLGFLVGFVGLIIWPLLPIAFGLILAGPAVWLLQLAKLIPDFYVCSGCGKKFNKNVSGR